MPCNVLQPPSNSPLSRPPSLPLSRAFSSVPLFPRATHHPALAAPALSRRGGVRSKFNFHRPTPLTYLPTFGLIPLLPPPPPPSLHFLYFPPRLPYRSGDPQHSGKEATGCIPRDKLRGSIIHGNLQAPLFKRRPFNIA